MRWRREISTFLADCAIESTDFSPRTRMESQLFIAPYLRISVAQRATDSNESGRYVF